jgi:hypothetical protein
MKPQGVQLYFPMGIKRHRVFGMKMSKATNTETTTSFAWSEPELVRRAQV